MKRRHGDSGIVIVLENATVQTCWLTRFAADRPVGRTHERPHAIKFDLVAEALSRIQTVAEPNRWQVNIL